MATVRTQRREPAFRAQAFNHVTLEVQEIHPVLNFRKANLRDHFDKG